MKRLGSLLTLLCLLLAPPPARAADGTVIDIFNRAIAASDTSLSQIQNFSSVSTVFGLAFTLKPSIEVRCDFSCMFPGFCFKYVNKKPGLDLTAYRTNHTTYTRNVRDAVSGQFGGLRNLTHNAILAFSALNDASDALLLASPGNPAALAEARFRQALDNAMTATSQLRNQSLRAVQSLDGAINALDGSAQFSRDDVARLIGETKAQVKADDRCTQGEEEQVGLLQIPADLIIAKIVEIVAPTIKAGRTAVAAMNELSQQAFTTYGSLETVSKNAPPGFMQTSSRYWVGPQAKNAVGDSKLGSFFSTPCASQDWCRPL